MCTNQSLTPTITLINIFVYVYRCDIQSLYKHTPLGWWIQFQRPRMRTGILLVGSDWTELVAHSSLVDSLNIRLWLVGGTCACIHANAYVYWLVVVAVKYWWLVACVTACLIGRCCQALPLIGRCYQASPLIGRGYQALPLIGRGCQASRLIGRCYQALPLIGRGCQALSLIGRCYQALLAHLSQTTTHSLGGMREWSLREGWVSGHWGRDEWVVTEWGMSERAKRDTIVAFQPIRSV